MAGKRNKFSKDPSGGDNNQGWKLYKKYEHHIKKSGGDIKDIDDLFARMDEFDLNENDCNWIKTYEKTNLGFDYPSNGDLLTLYTMWYKVKKTGKMDSLKDHFWDQHFNDLAVKHNKENADKTPNEAYLRRKMQKIIDAIMMQTGKTGLPNPIGAHSRRSAKDVVKAADLSVFTD